MLELGRKERHLLSAIGVQILIVALLVFGYTQAIRQVKHRRQLQLRLQEQLGMAREQLTRQGADRPDLSRMQSELAGLRGFFLSAGGLSAEMMRVKELAAVEHGFGEVQVKVGEMPVEILRVPAGAAPAGEPIGGSVLEVALYPVELVGQATSRSVEEFIARLGDPSFRPILSLVAMEMKRAEPAGLRPVSVRLQYLVPVSAGSPSAMPPFAPRTGQTSWGSRAEPFLPGGPPGQD